MLLLIKIMLRRMLSRIADLPWALNVCMDVAENMTQFIGE